MRGLIRTRRIRGSSRARIASTWSAPSSLRASRGSGTQELRRLSGGERQRAFIAMTLAQDTDLIVLDEPTTYLDIRACHETMELIRRLNEEAARPIVMVIPRSRPWALRYSDRLLVMERGRAAAGRTVEEVPRNRRIERAFGVSIRPHEAAEGRAYTLFPGVGFCDAAPQAWHREPSGKRWGANCTLWQ